MDPIYKTKTTEEKVKVRDKMGDDIWFAMSNVLYISKLHAQEEWTIGFQNGVSISILDRDEAQRLLDLFTGKKTDA